MHDLTYDGGDTYKAVLINRSFLFSREGLIHPSSRVAFSPTRLPRATANTPRYVKTLYWLCYFGCYGRSYKRFAIRDYINNPAIP